MNVKVKNNNTPMISDYIITNINHNFQNKSILTPAKHTLARTASHQNTLLAKPTLTKELIKQQLPSLIRKNNDPPFLINETQRKSPSPISKSRLKMVLESSKQDNLKAVVKKSPLRSHQLTTKSSVSDLMDCKTPHGRSVASELEEDKENNVLEAYRQKRKQEQTTQKSLRKLYGKHP